MSHLSGENWRFEDIDSKVELSIDRVASPISTLANFLKSSRLAEFIDENAPSTPSERLMSQMVNRFGEEGKEIYEKRPFKGHITFGEVKVLVQNCRIYFEKDSEIYQVSLTDNQNSLLIYIKLKMKESPRQFIIVNGGEGINGEVDTRRITEDEALSFLVELDQGTILE